MNQKFDLYEEAGVLAYWIVDSEKEVVLQYFNKGGRLVRYKPISKNQILTSKVIHGFETDLGGCSQLFY